MEIQRNQYLEVARAEDFGSLAEMVKELVLRGCGASALRLAVMESTMGLLNVRERNNQYETAELVGISRQRVWHAQKWVADRLFSRPLPPAVDDVVSRALALFDEHGRELRPEELEKGLDEAFGWTGTTAFSVRRLLGYCGIELVDLPDERGLGWNEDGRFDGIGTPPPSVLLSKRSPTALSRNKKQEAVRTVLEEAGPRGLETGELAEACNRRFPDAGIREGVLRGMVSNGGDLGDGKTRMVLYERGRKGGGSTRISLNSFFGDDGEVLQEAATSIRSHMERTGVGIVSAWKAWHDFRGRLPVDLPELGFYMMMRDIGAGGLSYPEYPRVSYPGIPVPENAFWWELHEYCALCGRTTATFGEIRAFFANALWMDFELGAPVTISTMGLERTGIEWGSPYVVSAPDPSIPPPGVLLPAIAGFRDFSLATPVDRRRSDAGSSPA